MKRFDVTFTGHATIDIAEEVLALASDANFCSYTGLQSREDIVQHIAFNLVINELTLSQVDGFADRKDDEAKVVEGPRTEGWEIEW